MNMDEFDWLLHLDITKLEGQLTFYNPKPQKINRFEIIDHSRPLDDGGGREVVVSPQQMLDITYEVQDGGRTLKVFINKG